MLNITQLLQDSIYCDNQVIDQRDLLLGPESHLKEILVHCDRSLAMLYHPAIDYDLEAANQGVVDHSLVLKNYVTVIHWFLLFSAQKQWTHLVVINKDSYKNLLASQRLTKLADQDQQYLTIKYFLLTSYYTHRQEDFRHAWHLLLKYGLVDLKLGSSEIMDEHERLVRDNLNK
ncbi:dUTPase [uncultured Limosilactobacillus sp.]|uniref:dUTPase n=1 Tax=uncultured Limosilactobacillus sp. TaxID=2837629 RepID=UPI0025FA9725|nr:dUTPase [uncultured Limosilactobacillus sp.]